MKNKNIILIMTILTLLIFIAFGCGGGQQKESPDKNSQNGIGGQEVFKVKMVGTLTLDHALTKALYVIKDYVEKESNGRVEFEVYPAQQLYNDKDLVEVLPNRAVEMAIANMDMWTGLVPSAGILYMPILYDDQEHFFRVAHGEPGDTVKKQIEEIANCKILGWIDYGTGDLISKKKIAKLSDWKGKRLRAFGEYISYFEQALGAAPTMMSSGEVYQALQKGTIDGAMSGLTSFNERKWYELCKYVADVHLAPVIPFMTVINLDFWNSLPEDLQKIFVEGAIEAEQFTRAASEIDTEKAIQVLKDNGVELVKITDDEVAIWREASLPKMIEEYKKNYDPIKASQLLDVVEKLR